jgi:hypothetical protein
MNSTAGWMKIAPHTFARITVRGDMATGIVVCSAGGEWAIGGVRVSIAAMRARLQRAMQRAPEILRRVITIAGVDDAEDDFDPLEGYEWIDEVGASRAERIARRRRKRQERRKRVARRFRNSVKRIAKALAKLKILDRLRKIGRTILRSKLVSKALQGGLTALGTAFGGPAGAMLGSGLARGLLGSQLDAGTSSAKIAAPSAYALGCGCGGARG